VTIETAKRRRLRRLQLDEQLAAARWQDAPPAPRRGWLRAIREALGMPAEAFGRRLGVTRSGALMIEKSESEGRISLNRLRAAADALGCDVVVLVVPRMGLDEMVQRRALAASSRISGRARQTMVMEDQGLSSAYLGRLRDELAQGMIDRADPMIWEDV
jgi:predicted DNA-binding mobile mystery protein A